jgi:hypothetical protein
VLYELAVLVDHLLIANCTAGSLQALRKQVEREEGGFILVDGLLLKNGQLVVLMDNMDEALIVDLIREAYDQVSFTYPRRAKIARILN